MAVRSRRSRRRQVHRGRRAGRQILFTGQSDRWLPPFRAGTHIDLRLPAECSNLFTVQRPADNKRYRVAVKRERPGGSSAAARSGQVGDVIGVSLPRAGWFSRRSPLHLRRGRHRHHALSAAALLLQSGSRTYAAPLMRARPLARLVAPFVQSGQIWLQLADCRTDQLAGAKTAIGCCVPGNGRRPAGWVGRVARPCRTLRRRTADPQCGQNACVGALADRNSRRAGQTCSLHFDLIDIRLRAGGFARVQGGLARQPVHRTACRPAERARS